MTTIYVPGDLVQRPGVPRNPGTVEAVWTSRDRTGRERTRARVRWANATRRIGGGTTTHSTVLTSSLKRWAGTPVWCRDCGCEDRAGAELETYDGLTVAWRCRACTRARQAPDLCLKVKAQDIPVRGDGWSRTERQVWRFDAVHVPQVRRGVRCDVRAPKPPPTPLVRLA